jgi:hypothetical protein
MGQDSEAFVHDNPPVVTVTEPLTDSVARPTIRVVASCDDDDPTGCAGMRIRFGGACEASNLPILFTTSDAALDTVVDLSSREGQYLDLCVDGLDSAGQVTTPEPMVYVESSLYLVEVASVPERILDFEDKRILWQDTSSSPFFLKLTHWPTLSEEAILPQDPSRRWFDGQASSLGAVVQRSFPGPGNDLGDFTNGVLQILPGNPSRYGVAGTWAIYSDNANILVRRDLATTTDETITTFSVGDQRYQVFRNGDVLWQASHNSPVQRYRAGTSTQLSPMDSRRRFPFATDGTNVAWVRIDNTGSGVYLWDGAMGEIELAPPGPNPSSVATHAGWVAYTRQGGSGVYQVWARSPAGIPSQVTFFSTSTVSRVLDVGPTGAVLIRTVDTDRLLHGRVGNPTLLDLGRYTLLKRFEDEVYMAIGRTLFRVDLPVFVDGFESGSTSAWSATVGGS